MASKKKYAEDLAHLKEEMRGMVDVMKLNGHLLSFEQGQDVANIQFRLEFALKNLVLETQVKEAKLKLQAMKDTLAAVKEKVIVYD